MITVYRILLLLTKTLSVSTLGTLKTNNSVAWRLYFNFIALFYPAVTPRVSKQRLHIHSYRNIHETHALPPGVSPQMAENTPLALIESVHNKLIYRCTLINLTFVTNTLLSFLIGTIYSDFQTFGSFVALILTDSKLQLAS